MKLDKIIVFLLVLLTAEAVFFDVKLLNIMYEYTREPNTTVGDVYSNTLLILRGICYISIFIGVFKLIKIRSIELIDAFKFPIFYYVIAFMFWHLLLLLRKENSILTLNNEFWYGYAFHILNIVFIILVCIYFSTRVDKNEINATVPASPKARFINWIIDIGLILLFTNSYFRNYQRELIWQDVFTQRESLHLLFFMYMFIYYFVLELIFLQTIGKLHNNSFVEYNGNRFSTILTRTLCRFIPLEAFTYFGNKGWHDLISKTKVMIVKKTI